MNNWADPKTEEEKKREKGTSTRSPSNIKAGKSWDGMAAPTTGPGPADANSDPPDTSAIIPTSKQHEKTTTGSGLFSKAILWSQAQWQQRQSTTTVTPGRSGNREEPPRGRRRSPSSSGSASPHHRITPPRSPPSTTPAIYYTGIDPSSNTHDHDHDSTENQVVNYYSHHPQQIIDGRGHYSHRRRPPYSHDYTTSLRGLLTQPDINATMSLLIAVAKAAQFTDAFLTGLLVPLIPTILESRAGVHHKHGMFRSQSHWADIMLTE